MQTREVVYTSHDVDDAEVNATFHIQEATADGIIHHAVAVPRDWMSLDVPIDDDPTAPTLASLHIEDIELGPRSGVVVCGSFPRGRFDTAREVAEALAARENFEIYRWNDDDKDDARAMASTEDHTMALRIVPYDLQWAFVSSVVPKGRLAEIGGVMRASLVTFKLLPTWALDDGDSDA
jgi:hypothetical protein